VLSTGASGSFARAFGRPLGFGSSGGGISTLTFRARGFGLQGLQGLQWFVGLSGREFLGLQGLQGLQGFVGLSGRAFSAELLVPGFRPVSQPRLSERAFFAELLASRLQRLTFSSVREKIISASGLWQKPWSSGRPVKL
jgi:hypothetical protein